MNHSTSFTPSQWSIEHSWTTPPTLDGITGVLAKLRVILELTLEDKLSKRVYITADELIRNALEHGCLGIGSEKKSELIDQGRFEEYIRQEEAKFSDLRINMELNIPTPYELILKVTDPGSGFELSETSEIRKVSSQSNKFASPDKIEKASERGLIIVQSLVEKLVIEKQPTRTSAYFALSQQP
jgi:hypothetical protein